MTAKTDGIEETLNALIEKLLPILNASLPTYIEDAGLDPWDEVLSGKETLGKINLGICTAKVKAKYNIKNMKGLSSLVIQSLTVESMESSGETTVTGTMKLAAKLSSSLSAKIGGSVSAECGVVKESIGISGKATAKGVTGQGNLTYTAELSVGSSCFTALKVKSLSLDYDDIKVEIDGLGIFNSFLQPLIDLIDVLFGDAIKGEVADALKPVFNDLIGKELPFCL